MRVLSILVASLTLGLAVTAMPVRATANDDGDAACIAECESDPSCADQCELTANALGAQCRENGGTEEACAALRQESLTQCLADECEAGPDPEPEPTCDWICAPTPLTGVSKSITRGPGL